MKGKLLRTKYRFKYIVFNYLPNLRSRQFIENTCRRVHMDTADASARTAMGFVREKISKFYSSMPRVARQSHCFISARARGTYQRFTTTRLKMRSLVRTGTLFGLRKAS